MGVDDEGKEFAPSPDPLLEELQGYVKNVKLGSALTETDKENAAKLLARKDVFAVDLNEIGLADRIIRLFEELVKGPGAVRKTVASL